MVKAVFFDLDDTLHDFRGASEEAMTLVYEKISGRYGVDISRLKAKYSELLRQTEENAFFDGRSSADYRLERFENLLLGFGIKDREFTTGLIRFYGDELEKRLNLLPGANSLLRRLQQRYDLYLVTEGPSDAQHRALELLGIEGYFKRIFISGEIKKKKSTGGLFKHAIEKSGHRAHDITLVGDSYARDVLGGLKAGLRVIWFNHKNEKHGDDPSVVEIKSLDEVESRLNPVPVLILGHPRSGTNFVSAIFRSHPRVNLLVEPFSQHSGFFSDHDSECWKRTNFDPEHFHPDLVGNPAMVAFLRDFRKWLYFDTGETRVFKETTFFLQLEWLKEYLPGLRVIYIERNPYGVVSSFKKADFFNRWGYSERFQALSQRVNNDSDLEEYRSMVATASRGSWVDQLTVMWYIRTREARKGLCLFDHVVFQYEDIIARPEPQFAKMFRFANLEMTEDVLKAIHERSVESKGRDFSTFRDSKKAADEWKSILTGDQKRIIRKYLARTGGPDHEKRKRIIR